MSSRADKKKAALLKAARSVVADGGFRALQMNTAAAAAGVAVGTIYRYFPSKAQLCAELVASVSRRELEVLRAIAKADGTPTQLLHDGVRTFTDRAFRSGRLAYAIIAEPVDPEVEDVRLLYRAEISCVFEQILAAGVADGAFDCSDIETASACIVGAFMEGVIGGPYARDRGAKKDDIAEAIEQIAQFCVAGALGSAQPDIVPIAADRRG